MNKTYVAPFETFSHQNKYYLIDVDRMSSQKISREAFLILNDLDVSSDKDLSEEALLALTEYRLLKKQLPKKKAYTLEAPPVTSIALFLTYACNLHCTYCYETGGDYEEHMNMSEETALRSVDWLFEHSKDSETVTIIFFGGEPLIKFPLLKTTVQYAEEQAEKHGKKVHFSTTTNATLLTDEIIDFFKDHNFSIAVSIDGPKEIHDQQRPFKNGQGSFDVIVPKIKKLLEKNPWAQGHAVMANNSNPAEIKTFLESLGFTSISTGMMSKSIYNKDSDVDLPISSASANTDHILQAFEQESEKWLDALKERNDGALKEYIEKNYLHDGIKQLLHNKKTHHMCAAGLYYLSISCNGDIYPCHRFGEAEGHCLGNVFESECNRDLFLKPMNTFVEKCMDCYARYYCGGGCRYLNCVDGQSVFDPSEDFCQIMRQEMKMAAYIHAELSKEDRQFLINKNIFPAKYCPLDF